MNLNKKHLKLLILLVTLISFVFIGYSLHENYTEFIDYNWSLNYLNLSIGVFFILFRLLTRSMVFVLLLDNDILQKHSTIKIIYSYSLSQVIKYIPGKVFGIITQSLHLTGKFVASAIWNAHAQHYLIVIYNSSVIILSIISAYYFDNTIILIFSLPLSILTILLIKHNVFSKIFNIIIGFFRKDVILQPINKFGTRILLFLNLEWLFFFISWYFLAPDSFDIIQIIGFAIVYEFAALLGAIIFIMPSGIIIREVLFVYIGILLGFEKEILVIYSVLIRLIYTFSDILFTVICNILFNLKNDRATNFE